VIKNAKSAHGAVRPNSGRGVVEATAETRLAQLQRRFRVLSACNRTLIHAISEHALLTDLCRAMVEVGGYRLAWVGHADALAGAAADAIVGGAWGAGPLAPSQVDWTHARGAQTPAARAMRVRATQVVRDVGAERWSADWRAQARERGLTAALAMPLLTEDHCLGVLEVYSDGPAAFDPAEIALLNELAADLAFGVAALRTRRECERHQTDVAQLTRVLKMQSAINSAVLRIRDRELLLQEACLVATEVGRYASAVVWVVEPGARRARPGFVAGQRVKNILPEYLSIGDGMEPDASLTGRAMRTGEVSVCWDLTRNEPPLVGRRERLLEAGIRSVVALPFMVDGVPVGALTLTSADSTLVREDELLLLQDIAASLSFAVRSLQQADAAEYLMHYDPLTGLAKRSLFCRRLDELLRTRSPPELAPTVTVLDIDHLNNFNDSFGRNFGDLLLQQVAERLRQQAGCDERVGDLGGGTFVLVAPCTEGVEMGSAALLDQTVFAQSFLIEGRSVRVSCHSGAARCHVDGEDAGTLVQKAEAALKRAKETGAQYLHYQLEMRSEIAERLALEHRLRVAIDEQQFELYYQPQVNIVSGHIESVEALLRWNDPEHGLLLPGSFLPVLESSGLIIPVGKWVVQRAREDCDRWRRSGLRPVRVAVNVSAVQFRGRAFIDFMLDLVKDWPRDPRGFGIDLEITETALLQDIDGAGRQLRELRAAGIRVALDDFGTGYSSLGLLSKLPVDLLKIDRSFVKGLPGDHTSMTLTRTIIGLASAFGLLTVAEGVETAEQCKLLRLLNCDQAQGYFHYPPVPVQSIDQILAQDQ
jgi:diguanylate cyclase (GGDEF)-like protein